MKLLLVSGLLFLALVETGYSLKCYQCMGSSTSCKESEAECDKNSQKPYCFKIVGEKSGKTSILKKCRSNPDGTDEENQCKTDSYEGVKGTACVCHTDLCNNAPVAINSKIIIFALIFVAIFLQFM